jgi:hypothetical protein
MLDQAVASSLTALLAFLEEFSKVNDSKNRHLKIEIAPSNGSKTDSSGAITTDCTYGMRNGLNTRKFTGTRERFQRQART